MRRKMQVPRHLMPVVIFALGIVSFLIMIFINYLKEKQGYIYSYNSLIMSIEISTANSHLWFEEYVTGDTTINVENTLAGIDQSVDKIGRLLNDSISWQGVRLQPLDDRELIARIEVVESLLKEFKSAAIERLAHPEVGGVGSALDQRFDEIYETLAGELERVERVFDAETVAIQKRSQHFFWAILLIWTAIISISVVGISKLEYFRRRADEALRASLEHRFTNILDNSGEAIISFDENQRIIVFNKGAENVFGYRADEVMGKPLDILIPPELVESYRTHYEEFAISDETARLMRQDAPISGRRKDGTFFPAEASISKVSIAGETIITTIMRDISERKRAEDAVRESDRKFRSVVQTAPNAIITADTEGNIIFWNKSAERIFGYTLEEAIGKPLTFIIPERLREKHLKTRRAILKGEAEIKNDPVNVIGLRKDGNEFPLELSLAKWQLKDETFFTEIIHDITDSEKKDEMVRKLSYAIDQSANSVVITDTDGNIEFVNPKFEKVTGYTFYEVKGKNMRVLKSGEASQEEYEELWKTISSGEEWKGEFHNKKKSGELYWERVSISPIKNSSGVITQFLGINEDITNSKIVEEKLNKEHELVREANKELKKAFAKEEKLRSALTNAEKLASLGEMASKIAHEINNPLTVIKGQAEIRAQMVSDEALKESLLIIKAKADQIKDLTRGYMNLAKPEEAELTKIKLRDVLRTTVRTLMPLGQLKSIKISEEYMKDEPSIFGDPGRLEQVFRNLIINAVDATTEKVSKEIRIGTKLSEDGKSVDAYVKDNGVGIKPENIEKIFEPYYTKKERAAGTGLGLVIVKETIENAHGGKLKVVSNIGAGTTFHVIIPSVEYSQWKKKLLIVDDDVSIAELLAQFFSNKGLSVNTAENGRIAIDCIDDFKPDLILSDIEMPELDGFGLLEEVIINNPEQLFIIMTGFNDNVNLKDKLRNRGVPIIMKPPDLEDELWPLIKEKLEIA